MVMEDGGVVNIEILGAEEESGYARGRVKAGEVYSRVCRGFVESRCVGVGLAIVV